MKSILIVDDDDDVRSVMRLVLHKNGFKILEAENGYDGLALASSKAPDLIISDVIMDNLNGFMLQEQLQKNAATSNIPLILITGAANKAGAWEAVKNVTYLQKPFGMDVLLKEVLKKLFPYRTRT